MNSFTNKSWGIIEYIVRKFLMILNKILKRDITSEQSEAIMQFVKFGIIGVSNTIVNYLIYIVSLVVLKNESLFLKYDYLIAQIVAFLLSVLWSFYWNNKLVFVAEEGQKRIWWQALIKSYVSYSFTGLFLNSILLIACVDWLGISEFVAPIINLIISVPVNFIINKFWAFSTK